MNHVFRSLLLTLIVAIPIIPARADEPAPDPGAIIDKGIEALGGKDKLTKAVAASWKTKGSMSIQGNDVNFSGEATSQGINQIKSEIEMDFNGNPFKGVMIFNVDKGWRKFNDNLMELDKDAVENEKHNLAMQLIPTTLVALKGKDFKLASAPEVKIGDKPAVGVKVTEPSGKDFTIYFDKESGLPVRVTGKVVGFGGEDSDVENNYTGYKDFNGIKRATKTTSKRNGEAFMQSEISDFKVLDKAPAAETFAEPK